MSSAEAPAGVLWLPPTDLYPERQLGPEGLFERLGTLAAELPAVRLPWLFSGRPSRIVRKVERQAKGLDSLSEGAILDKAFELRGALRARGLADDLVARAFALAREAADRTTGLRPYDVQLTGGFALLKGVIAEMAPGEGKTLAAALAAGAAALAGIPVHVITPDDHLTRRDAARMGPVYRALGLSVGAVVHGMARDERRAAYRCDVTYCTAKEVAFDYLRDRLALGRAPASLRLKLERLHDQEPRADKVVMRGLHFAIVDEADSVLIDEARTPLIVSGQTDPGAEKRAAEQAIRLAAELETGVDFRIAAGPDPIELTDRGRARVAELAERSDGPTLGRVRRDEAGRQALAALYLFRRDEHYTVRDATVRIADEYAGRTGTDASSGEGLRQLIEAKEGCPVTGRKVALARMTYQGFLRRYQRLSGLTATAREAAGEFWAVYRLPVVKAPPRAPIRRRRGPDRLCPTDNAKWRRIVRRARDLQAQGRPVLVATRSAAAAERASRLLDEAGVAHVVLSGAQGLEEAEVLGRAGEAGRVTVATGMAGRGVDIPLGPGVAALGGLHVILSERHESARIDRRLLGRCGRRGEPGTAEAIVSLEDPLLEPYRGAILRALARLPGPSGRWPGRVLFNRAQHRAERAQSRLRRELIRYDERLNTLLAFAGRAE